MKRKSIRITEEQLQTLIKEAVENYHKNQDCHLNNLFEDYETSALLSAESLEEVNEILAEGLIMSYPVDKVKQILIRNLGIEAKSITTAVREIDGIKNTLLTITLPLNIEKDIIGAITTQMQTCGYFKATPFRKTKQDPTMGSVTYEPKFPKDITAHVRQNCKYLLHTTPTIYLHKILEKGLIPYHKSKALPYPDTVFFMVGENIDKEQEEILKKVQIVRNARQIDKNNPNEKYTFALLTIDLSLVPEDVKFYDDPASINAVYTYDNIPPQAIVNYREFNLVDPNVKYLLGNYIGLDP